MEKEEHGASALSVSVDLEQFYPVMLCVRWYGSARAHEWSRVFNHTEQDTQR